MISGSSCDFPGCQAILAEGDKSWDYALIFSTDKPNINVAVVLYFCSIHIRTSREVRQDIANNIANSMPET